METVFVTKDFKKYFYDMESFCKQAEIDNNDHVRNKGRSLCQTTLNMTNRDWHHNSASLLYKIFINKDFSNGNGGLTLVYNGSEIAALSGVERLEFDPENVVRFGSRLFTLKKYRNKKLWFNYMLPKQILWCLSNDIKVGLFTINDYNQSLLKLTKRMAEKKKAIFGRKAYSMAKKFKYVDRMLKIKGVYQHVFYFELDPDYTWIIPEEIK
jgi:hypothetical protein